MDELVAVSRLDGELTTLATDVREFYHDTSGRYVIWQGTELTNGDPDRPRGPISLLDRQTGEVTQLIVGSLSDTFSQPFTLGELGLLHLWIEADGVERFYRLPTLEFIDVPDHLGVLWLVDDHRALVSHQFPINSPFSLIDALTGELTPLYDGPGNIVRGADTGMFMLDNGPCCADGDDNDGYRKAGALRFVPYDGGAALVARRATYNFVPAADGRVITPVEVGADWTGSLISVGPDTLDEQLIDEDVLIFWPSIDSEIEGDPVIVYAIDHPERQGIWLARLAN